MSQETYTYQENEERTEFSLSRTNGIRVIGQVLELTPDRGWRTYATYTGENSSEITGDRGVTPEQAGEMVTDWKQKDGVAT